MWNNIIQYHWQYSSIKKNNNYTVYMQTLNELETSFPTGGGVKEFWKKERAHLAILHPDTIVV